LPTEREKQILDLIRQNPMISQKELAEKLGITRPGVASHISRLIKEGLILGKGYVLPKKEYVTVIGAVNMDIYGIVSDYPVVLKGSQHWSRDDASGRSGQKHCREYCCIGIRHQPDHGFRQR
jgi:pseudouridine kinase